MFSSIESYKSKPIIKLLLNEEHTNVNIIEQTKQDIIVEVKERIEPWQPKEVKKAVELHLKWALGLVRVCKGR